MKLTPWDPDLQTLTARILNGDLNLQPDFQRGEVWGTGKKRRLIDTILRGWHVPPVHVVVDPETELQEILDGQQRLAAIRDFADGLITVDGTCLPDDNEIKELDGILYEDLPVRFRRRFDSFSIRVIKISDFEPDEPGELFYRLNQPTNLTAAEQRNAFFGPIRSQVKKIVSSFSDLGINEAVLGFKNSRMAYDDIVARVCFVHREGSLRTKITAGLVTNLYRSGEQFDQNVVRRVTDALETFSGGSKSFSESLKFNKATLFSWLTFIAQLRAAQEPARPSQENIGRFIRNFEITRQSYRDPSKSIFALGADSFPEMPSTVQRQLIAIFNDRATSRVADVSSVCARDFVLWSFAISSPEFNCGVISVLSEDARACLEDFHQSWTSDVSTTSLDETVERIAGSGAWGNSL